MNNPKHIARTSDPVTSKQAANEVTASGRRQSQADKLLKAIEMKQGNTAGEYAWSLNMTMHQVSRRLADLRNDGKVHNDGTAMWNGRPQMRWWLGGDPEQQKPRPHCKSCSCYEERFVVPERENNESHVEYTARVLNMDVEEVERIAQETIVGEHTRRILSQLQPPLFDSPQA
jgi:hypothetical protein